MLPFDDIPPPVPEASNVAKYGHIWVPKMVSFLQQGHHLILEEQLFRNATKYRPLGDHLVTQLART